MGQARPRRHQRQLRDHGRDDATQGGPPLHRHSREDESFYILEGDFVFEVDGERIPAGSGCTLFAPRGTAHTFQNVGKIPGRMLIIVQPAGLDFFFEEVAQVASGMGQPDLNVIVPLFQKYGLELLGAPIGRKGRSDRTLILVILGAHNPTLLSALYDLPIL